MTTELTPLDSLKHFNLVENGLVVTGQPTYDEWREGWRWLKRFDNATPWIVGDMLIYGELTYDGRADQEFDPDEDAPHHFTYESLREYKRVAVAFPVSSRLVCLPWSYYQTVASLPIEQALALLQHCAEARIKRAELRMMATQLNGGRITQSPTRPADRQFELETENHLKDRQIASQEETISQQQEYIDHLERQDDAPTDLPAYAIRALDDAQNALIEFGYSSVTIYQNGDVTWHK